MSRYIQKEDLQDKQKGDLISMILLDMELGFSYTRKDLDDLSYDELVDIIVDSKEIKL